MYFVSALYLLNPLWDLQITLHICQVWWDDVQCLGLTKIGLRSRSQSKIKHCMTVFRVRSISYKSMEGFTNNFAQMLAMMRRCAVPMFDLGRFKVKVKVLVWTCLVCIFCTYLQITLRKCQVWWVDAHCICLAMVSLRSWSKLKVEYCMTVLLVRSITLEKMVTL